MSKGGEPSADGGGIHPAAADAILTVDDGKLQELNNEIADEHFFENVNIIHVILCFRGVRSMYKHNTRLTKNARCLRKNMTKEERHLWYDFLRTFQIRVIRQKVIENYIADFYCARAKLVIELDGSQHFEKDGAEYDKIRTEKLEAYGLTVIRIPNNEVNKNFDGVCEYIHKEIIDAVKFWEGC